MKKGANNTYWGNIKEAVGSLYEGLILSLRHLWEARESRTPIGIDDKNYFEQDTGIVTLQYPNESFPVPDNGRYRLHNEIDDCIVCDKCAKICPVNCIEIEPVRAIDEDLGKTSDGTPKRIYAAKFDIDMGKCCFCGLCTTVCPTECLTMTKAYDFTEFDVADHIYAFAEMTPLEILEKKQKLDAYNEQKAAALAAKKPADEVQGTSAAPKLKPSFKPKVKRDEANEGTNSQSDAKSSAAPSPKPTFKPRVKAAIPVVKKDDEPGVEANVETNKESTQAASPAKPKPVFRPKVKPSSNKTEENTAPKATSEAGEAKSEAARPKPVFKPKIKPVIKKEEPVKDASASEGEKDAPPVAKPKPVFKPKIKPVIKKEEGSGEGGQKGVDDA